MKQYLWQCKCGMRILSVTQPQPKTWADGHRCRYERVKGEGEASLPLPTLVCPRCRKRNLFEDDEYNFLSLDLSVVCPLCGQKELSDELYKLRQIPD